MLPVLSESATLCEVMISYDVGVVMHTVHFQSFPGSLEVVQRSNGFSSKV